LTDWSDLIRSLKLEELYGILLAILLGGVIGMERELRGKAAGLRTNVLICMGATIFTQLSVSLSGDAPAKTGLAVGVVSGVGFLGAGTIMQGKGSITGLTTAATIWLVAAIGVAIGSKEIFLAGGATLIAVLVLRLMGWLEFYLQRHSEVTRLSVAVEGDPRRVEEVEQLVREAGVVIDEIESAIQGDKIVVSVTLRGPKRAQDLAKLSLLRS
jgi:putative Mg2+ transporter-C (MgtC) family protein